MNGVRWIVTLVISVFIIMLVIWAIKKVASKYNIPVVSTVAEQV